MKAVLIVLALIFISYLSACNTTSNDKEVEQLRKEAELSKKEAELAKKELEIAKSESKSTPSPDNKNTQIDSKSNLIKVRLRLLSQGAMHYSPLEDLTVILETQGKIFKEKTDSGGWATFKAIPCGEMIIITSPQFELQNDKVWQVKRNLQCTNSQVVIGSYGDLAGHLLTKEDFKYILN